jgi:hypothetical protein|nr:MAG TPA: Succinoglycan biosynthesis protein [Caudoviricetes sp.]
MKSLLIGLVMGIVLVIGCSGVPAENRNSVPSKCIFRVNPDRVGEVHVFTYNGSDYMVATNGYKGGISIIQIRK